MDTNTKTTSDISNFTKMINAREKSKTIDNQALRIFNIIHCCFSIAYGLTIEFCKNLLQMIFTDDMWGYDQAPFLMFIEILDKYIFIRRPAATCDKHFIILLESINDRQLF